MNSQEIALAVNVQRRLDMRSGLLLIPGGLLLVAAVLLALLSLAWPFGPDHAIMTVVGRAWRNGGAPYATFIDVKGPLAYVPYLIGDWIANGSMAGLRILDLTVVSVAAAATFRALRGVVGLHAAGWAALLLFGICFRVGYTDSAQPDEWVALATAVVFCQLIRHQRNASVSLYFTAGLLAGSAALIKPQYAILGGFSIFIGLAWGTKETRARVFGFLTLGAILPVIVTCAVLWAQGALDDMLQIATGPFLRSYAAGSSLAQDSRIELGRMLNFPFRTSYGIPLVILSVLGGFGARQIERRFALALMIWIAGALSLVMIQGRFFTYQWFPMIPPLAILSGLALGRTIPEWSATPQHYLRRMAAGAGVIAVVGLAASFAGRAWRDLLAVQHEMQAGAGAIEAVRFSQPRAGFAPEYRNTKRVAEFMREHARPDMEVGTWLYDPSPLLLSNLRPNARVFFMHPVLSQAIPFADSVLFGLATELNRESPEFVIVDCNLPWQDSLTAPERSPAFVRVLERKYERKLALGGLTVFRRTEADGHRNPRSDSSSLRRVPMCGTPPADHK